MLSSPVASRSWVRSAVLLAGLAASAPSMAADEKEKMIPGDFTGSVAFLTDYTFRGISQTDSKPAVQGGLEWAYTFKNDISIYTGIWASNVDFDDGDQAQAEVDLTGGVRGTIDKFSWQLGFTYYYYPGAKVAGDQYDYYEFSVKGGYDFGFVNLTGLVAYSPDYFFETGTGVYVSGDAAIPLPFAEKFEPAITLHVGHQSIDDNTKFGTPDYIDWAIGVTGKIDNFVLALQYVDTDIKKSECFAGSGITKTCEGRVVFSVTRPF
jgi:uncharacterized protein (TIGR02001 family)